MSEAPKVSVLLHLQIVQMQTEQENICKRLLQKVEKLRQVSIEKLFQTWDFLNINSLLNSFSLLTLHSYFIRQVNNATARVQTKKMPSIPNGKSLTFSHDSLLARHYYIAMSKYKHSLLFFNYPDYKRGLLEYGCEEKFTLRNVCHNFLVSARYIQKMYNSSKHIVTSRDL